MHEQVRPIRPSLYDQLHDDPDVQTLIQKSDAVLAALGYTDHGARHVTLVARNASKLLAALGYDKHVCDLAAVAGLLHDIGNCAGRNNHASAGATLAFSLLSQRGVDLADLADIAAAIGNHDELEHGAPVSPPSAALIIADKADIHRSRVRMRDPESFDVHDRVNFAVTDSDLDVAAQMKSIELRLTADTAVATPAQIAELFEQRFVMSDAAARFLGCGFSVVINGITVR